MLGARFHLFQGEKESEEDGHILHFKFSEGRCDLPSGGFSKEM